MLGLGLAIPEVARRGGTDPATIALIARMAVAPPVARIGRIDALVRALKAAGVWDKLHCLWVMAAHDAQAARVNWTSASYSLAAVNAPVFSVDRGYAGDGTTSCLDTGFVPEAGAALNSMAMGYWLNAGTDQASDARIGMGAGSSGTASVCFLFPRTSAGTVYSKINTSVPGAGTSAAGTALGFSAVSRTGATVNIAYRNGASGATNTSVSADLPDRSIFLGGHNAGSLQSALDNRFAAAFIASGLSTPEMLGLYDALNAYLTAIGAA